MLWGDRSHQLFTICEGLTYQDITGPMPLISVGNVSKRFINLSVAGYMFFGFNDS